MARRAVEHEEHINHEAWAIPYADLMTLLLAFFVVMYAISSVNEGKLRAVSKSFSTAFTGSKVIEPIPQVDAPPERRRPAPIKIEPQSPLPESSGALATAVVNQPQAIPVLAAPQAMSSDNGLSGVADDIEKSMTALIDKGMLVVRRHQRWIEVEIRADVLFPSGTATLSAPAVSSMRELAGTLSGFENPLHIEGHTDNVPIATAEFPSNWELSASRAARVARLFVENGIDPKRISISGLGEFRPEASNDTDEGRNKNRRVKLIVLDDGHASIPDELRASVPENDGAEPRVAQRPVASAGSGEVGLSSLLKYPTIR